MSVVVSDIEGTLITGSSWKGLGSYYKEHFSPWRYNLFFARWIPRYLFVGLGIMSRREAIHKWMLDEILLFNGMRLNEFRRMAESIVERVMWPNRRPEIIMEIENLRH